MSLGDSSSPEVGGRGLRSADLWSGLVVVGVGVLGLVGGLAIFVPRGLSDYLGPRTFPLGISVALLVLGALLLVRAVRHGDDYVLDRGSLTTLGVVSGSIVAYLAVFELLGFLVATALLLAFLFHYLGEKRIWLAVLAAAVGSTLVTLLFTLGLNVALPVGPLGF